MRKLTTIYIDKYLCRYIKTLPQYYNGRLHIDSRANLNEYLPQDFKSAFKYLTTMEGKEKLEVIMYQPTKQRLYAVIRMYKQHFRKKLFIISSLNREFGLEVKADIDNYLDMLKISEDEFKRETAYKAVQRYFAENRSLAA